MRRNARSTGAMLLSTTLALAVGIAVVASAQQAPGPADRQTGPAARHLIPQNHRPPIAYTAKFQQLPSRDRSSIPLVDARTENTNLETKMYGPGKDGLVLFHHWDEPKDDPTFIWTGNASASWAVAFRDRNNLIDLTGLGKIRWRKEMTGFHQLRPLVKLADGMWLIGEHTESWTPDWHVSEFWPAWIRWRRFDINKALEMPTGTPFENGRFEPNPDLSRVDEVGFTDMMAGSGSGQGGWTRFEWMEVHGVPIPRTGQTARAQ